VCRLYYILYSDQTDDLPVNRTFSRCTRPEEEFPPIYIIILSTASDNVCNIIVGTIYAVLCALHSAKEILFYRHYKQLLSSIKKKKLQMNICTRVMHHDSGSDGLRLYFGPSYYLLLVLNHETEIPLSLNNCIFVYILLFSSLHIALATDNSEYFLVFK